MAAAGEAVDGTQNCPIPGISFCPRAWEGKKLLISRLLATGHSSMFWFLITATSSHGWCAWILVWISRYFTAMRGYSKQHWIQSQYWELRAKDLLLHFGIHEPVALQPRKQREICHVPGQKYPGISAISAHFEGTIDLSFSHINKSSFITSWLYGIN